LTALSNLLYAVNDTESVYWKEQFLGQIFSYGAPALGMRTFFWDIIENRTHSLLLFWCKANSTGIIYITKVVKPCEVAVASACLQFCTMFGAACGAAFSTLIYASVGNLDGSEKGDITDEATKNSLLHGLRASYWFWAGLCFFGMHRKLYHLQRVVFSHAGCALWNRRSYHRYLVFERH
jgi:hypothetical protein